VPARTAPSGVLGDVFHKLLSKGKTPRLAAGDSLVRATRHSVVLLASEYDVLEKMAYTLAILPCGSGEVPR